MRGPFTAPLRNASHRIAALRSAARRAATHRPPCSERSGQGDHSPLRSASRRRAAQRYAAHRTASPRPAPSPVSERSEAGSHLKPQELGMTSRATPPPTDLAGARRRHSIADADALLDVVLTDIRRRRQELIDEGDADGLARFAGNLASEIP